MQYSVNLRMKNPGNAKYLIESHDTITMAEAFNLASSILDRTDSQEHFVEIIDNKCGEKIASFNEGN